MDSSVTPYRWGGVGKERGANFLGAPDQPYFPSSGDFRKHGKIGILEVPVTLINPFWDKIPPVILRFINPFNRFHLIPVNLILRIWLACQRLKPTFSTAREMLKVTEYLSQKAALNTLVLSMMFHSNEATAEMSPYNATSSEVDEFLKRLKKYFQVLSSQYDVPSIRLSDTVNVLEAKTSGRAVSGLP